MANGISLYTNEVTYLTNNIGTKLQPTCMELLITCAILMQIFNQRIVQETNKTLSSSMLRLHLMMHLLVSYTPELFIHTRLFILNYSVT